MFNAVLLPVLITELPGPVTRSMTGYRMSVPCAHRAGRRRIEHSFTLRGLELRGVERAVARWRVGTAFHRSSVDFRSL